MYSKNVIFFVRNMLSGHKLGLLWLVLAHRYFLYFVRLLISVSFIPIIYITEEMQQGKNNVRWWNNFIKREKNQVNQSSASIRNASRWTWSLRNAHAKNSILNWSHRLPHSTESPRHT